MYLSVWTLQVALLDGGFRIILVCGVVVFMSFFWIVDETVTIVCVPSGQWREWMCLCFKVVSEEDFGLRQGYMVDYRIT